MKIKSDFVTNSSSTAYVVFIPNRFKASETKIESFYNTHCYNDEDRAYDSRVRTQILDAIESLKFGETLWTYGGGCDDETPGPIYYCVLDICQENGLVISSSEMGGEGNNTILGIKEEKVQDIMFNHINMDSLFKTVAKGEELCCEVKKDLP